MDTRCGRPKRHLTGIQMPPDLIETLLVRLTIDKYNVHLIKNFEEKI